MIHGVIMAGGAGTRFWPASRRQNPKQLLKLLGDSSMLQATVQRLDQLVPAERVMIVTNRQLVDPIRQQLPEIPVESIVGEPAKRDTAPCIGLAAALVAAKDPDGIMVVMPADHVIQPAAKFTETIRHAVTLVENDLERIVTLGIKPHYPAEVFGYIERTGSPIGGAIPTFRVQQFREKPDSVTAAKFLESGQFYWNSGIFVWNAKTILGALNKFAPEIYTRIEAIQKSIGTSGYATTLDREFNAITGTSIDYAVMEKYDNVLVVEAPFEWDDLGNWTALPKLRGTDENGNTVVANHLGIDTRGSIVRSDDDHLIVTVGLEELIVVRTRDATLVASKSHESKIREIVKSLEQNGRDEYL